MNFRSFDDMARAIRGGLSRLPADIDVVVGVPRSGLTPASMIALHRNVMITDLEGFLEGRAMQPGEARDKPSLKRDPSLWKRALIVDDSVNSGKTFARIRDRLAALGRDVEVVTCAVFGVQPTHPGVDIVLTTCPEPRVFEWNFLHHAHQMSTACLDIDGVLCVDPTRDQNDDGERYRNFLSTAVPHLMPTVPVGHLVTSRLERYRAETEDWLGRKGIAYGKLHMLDLPTAAERRRLGAHGTFKAEVYKSLHKSWLFVESEADQARKIARLSGKAVICVDGMFLCDQSLPATLTYDARRIGRRGLRRVRKVWTDFNSIWARGRS